MANIFPANFDDSFAVGTYVNDVYYLKNAKGPKYLHLPKRTAPAMAKINISKNIQFW